MTLNFLKNRNGVYILGSLVILIYVIIIGLRGGHDINVYLFASDQLFNGENIYSNNPYNNYLYGPLFCILLRPLSLLDFDIARVVWAIFNVIISIRLWKILSKLLTSGVKISSRLHLQWTIGIIFISLGYIIHNLNLGQITILILWLTFEGLHQIMNEDKQVKGSLLLALGILIKIIPLIGFFYLFFKGKFKALTICIGLIIVGLFLPSLIVGHDYTVKMSLNWFETISPTNNKYVFENDGSTQSLSAILPAYFFDFNEDKNADLNLKRQITALPHDTLVVIMQGLRIILLLSSIFLIFYRIKDRKNASLYFYWEIAYLALVSALIFPHQQKYAMLYFVPAGGYLILFVLLTFKPKNEVPIQHKFIAILSILLMFSSAIMGRDIVGNYIVNVFDYYHVFGLINLVFLFLLIYVKPNLILDLNRKLNFQ